MSLTRLLPPPQMGACFSKVFNGCPLRIHTAVTWIHPVTRGRPGRREEAGTWEFPAQRLTSDPLPKPADQFLVVGAEEGIYTLNLHELHEDTLEKVRHGWLRRGEILGGPGVLTLSICHLRPPADLTPLRLALLCE